ncbi:MAG: RHS repeat-associated core domain-containing protein, partial [Flavobacteriales bacterium]
FGARMLDVRIGRWLSGDPLEAKYPNLNPYNFVANSPLVAIDPDGRDIVVLNAPSGANNFGHGAILIGNDKDGWTFYSKNGTEDHDSKGASYMPDDGRQFNSLKDFANSTANFDADGDVYYTEAIRLKSSKEVDEKMKKAASETVCSKYELLKSSCIDVPSSALKAGGFNDGIVDKNVTGQEDVIGIVVGQISKNVTDIPRVRYEQIKKRNPGAIDVTVNIKPDIEVARLRKSVLPTAPVNINANSTMDAAPAIYVNLPTKQASKDRANNPQLFDGLDNNDNATAPTSQNNCNQENCE